MPRKPGYLLPVCLLLALLLFSLAAVSRVSDNTLAVLRGGFGVGPATVLRPGWHLRVPALQVIHRYPAAPFAIAATGDFTSAEGASLHLPYQLSARIDPDRLTDFDEKARGRAAHVFLEEALRRILAAWTSEESAEKWASGERRFAPPA